MYVLTAGVGGKHAASGGMILLLGLVALAYGLPYATNYRGWADRWVEGWHWQRSGLSRRFFIRSHAAFAIIGAFATVLGLAFIIAGHP